MVIKKRVQKEVGGILRKEWKCVESRIDSKCLYYGRFILSPLPKGQGDTIGITMRRVLLGEIKGTSITRAKLNKIQIFHEYGRIVGLEEPIYEILENLKQIVLRSFTNRILKASIRVSGPGCITAKDISVSPFVQIVDTTQYIATLTKPIDLSIELQIERDRGYRVKHKQNFQDGSYPIDAVFMPVRAVNYTIHNCQNENEDGEILFLEIWTNGSLTPREALREASRNSIELFMPFLYPEKTDILLKKKKQTFMIPPLIFQDRTSELKFWEEIEEFKKETDETIEELNELRKKNKKLSISWDSLFIDQFELSSETYYCLLRSERRTLLDIINTEPKDFFKIPNFRTEYLVELNFTMAKILKCLVILYQDQTPK